MNKQVKLDVLEFMKNIETKNMNTNNFVLEFFRYKNWKINENEIRNWISFESISRSRRYWLSQEKIWNLNLWLSRTETSRDTEQIYKNEFQRTPLGIF